MEREREGREEIKRERKGREEIKKERRNDMSKTLAVVINLLVIVAGVALVALNASASLFAWIVRVLGLALLLPAICTLLWIFTKKAQTGIEEKHSRSRAWGLLLLSVIGLVFGVLFLAMVKFWVQYVFVAFAIVLFIYGVYQLSTLWKLRARTELSSLFLALPILAIVSAIGLAIMNPSHENMQYRSVSAIFCGVILCVCGINALWSLGNAAHQLHISKKEGVPAAIGMEESPDAAHIEESESKKPGEGNIETSPEREEEESLSRDPDGMFE